MRLHERLLATGVIPDALLRRVIRARVRHLVRGLDRLTPQQQAEREAALVAAFESGPVTINTADANRQHYELPPAFFAHVLGPRFKYSCCQWSTGGGDGADRGGTGEGVGGRGRGRGTADSLARAEEAMLELTAERAGLANGQSILDLGCGWGSFALWAAERYPAGRVVAVSNSSAQRRFIEYLRQERGLGNLQVITADVGHFEPGEHFDRVVSVEMLEHVRNHRLLLERVADWLNPEGRLFVHVFCHRRHLYAFEPGATGGWMARHFFSGGIMPSWDYLTRYQTGLPLADRWEVDGREYARTLRAWLQNLDRRRDEVMPILESVYGRELSRLWLQYWRIFFMACEETFALDEGRSYFVGHYLFSRSPS